MAHPPAEFSRRSVLKLLGAGAIAGVASKPSVLASDTQPLLQAPASPVHVLMDGHVHVTNRVYWGKMDPWQPHDGGWDYARAWAAGVNCIIDDIGTYGYWNYNYTPKQTLRLIETFTRFAETHADKMAVALSVADARNIIESGRMAVFLGNESGWDHEGDPDVLAAFFRLGLRVVQFATQTGFNAFSDSALAATIAGQPKDRYHGINDRGRALVTEMNRLGILIDITHGTEAAQLQLIAASRAPVVASHESMNAVSGVGLSDEVLEALAKKGGLVGIHGGAAAVGKRYRRWLADNPAKARISSTMIREMSGYQPTFTRKPGDHGEYIAQFDQEIGERLRALADWKEFPEAVAYIPTSDEWAEHVDHVIKTVGADYVAIGLDMAGGRSGVPQNSGGYPALIAALDRITSPENVRKIAGENWFRVLSQAKAS